MIKKSFLCERLVSLSDLYVYQFLHYIKAIGNWGRPQVICNQVYFCICRSCDTVAYIPLLPSWIVKNLLSLVCLLSSLSSLNISSGLGHYHTKDRVLAHLQNGCICFIWYRFLWKNSQVILKDNSSSAPSSQFQLIAISSACVPVLHSRIPGQNNAVVTCREASVRKVSSQSKS